MRLGVVWLVGMLSVSALAQERRRPRVAVVPLDLPATKLAGEQKALDDFWLGLVSRTQPVELATPDVVRDVLRKKFGQGCPDGGLAECLRWVAERTSSAYAVHVRLQKLSPSLWQLEATIVASNGAAVSQPPVRTFAYPDATGTPLKIVVRRQLEDYVKALGLEALPANPSATAPSSSAEPPREASAVPPPAPPLLPPPPLVAISGAAGEPSPPPPVPDAPTVSPPAAAVPDAAPSVVTPAATPVPPAGPAVASEWRWGPLTLGAGALAAGVGLAFGAAALSSAQKAAEGPLDQYDPTLVQARGHAERANAAFAIAGVLGAAGAVMLAVHF